MKFDISIVNLYIRNVSQVQEMVDSILLQALANENFLVRIPPASIKIVNTAANTVKKVGNRILL